MHLSALFCDTIIVQCSAEADRVKVTQKQGLRHFIQILATAQLTRPASCLNTLIRISFTIKNLPTNSPPKYLNHVGNRTEQRRKWRCLWKYDQPKRTMPRPSLTITQRTINAITKMARSPQTDTKRASQRVTTRMTPVSHFPPPLTYPSHQTNAVSQEDERSIANRLAAQSKKDKQPEPESDEAKLAKLDPTGPAKMHGNEPSKGAKIDKEIEDEEAEILAKKGSFGPSKSN